MSNNEWGQPPDLNLPSWLREPLTPAQPSTPKQANWEQQPFPPTQPAWGQPAGGKQSNWGQQLPPLPGQPTQRPSPSPTQPVWEQPVSGNQSGWTQQAPSPSGQTWGQQPPLPPTQPAWGQSAGGNQSGWTQQAPSPSGQTWGQQPSLPSTQTAWGQPAGGNQSGWTQQPPPPPLQYALPGQFQSPQTQPKKKKNRLWVALGVFVGILVLCSVMINLATKNSDTTNTTNTANTPTTTSNNVAVATSAPTPTPTPTLVPTPTFTPTPTETPAQQVGATYKNSTVSTTVANLDRDGNADQGKDVHFICTILSFEKDQNGITVGATVAGTDNTFSFVYLSFPSGTDITQLNQDDTLEIWGPDVGISNSFDVSGAYGSVVINAKYLTDQTSNYQTGS